MQFAFLLLWLGEKGVFSTWKIESDEENDIEVYFDKFKNHITPKVNTVFARFQFFYRNQKEGKKSEVYITALKVLAQHCDHDAFKCEHYLDRNLTNEIIRDKIIAGIHLKEIKQRLLQSGDKLDLKQVVDKIHAHEAAQSQLDVMSSQSH